MFNQPSHLSRNGESAGGEAVLFDSHAHLIADDPMRYPIAPAGGAPGPLDLKEPMTAERLLREMDDNRVQRSVLVQRASVYGYDNRYVCESAARYPRRFSAVAAIDAASADAPDQVRYWVREQGAVGVRLMEPVRGADLSWLVAPQVWRAAADLDVPVCVHFFRWNRLAGLPALQRILAGLPETQVVVDHFSNMGWEGGPPDYGLDAPLLALVRYPRLCIKFTTIPLGALARQAIDAAPILTRVAAEFGAERLMWGSDITQSEGTYSYMAALAARATASLPAAMRRQVLYETAEAVYGRSAVSKAATDR
jgi:predicted TIM-barrel fold metal-dependent hydrolase